MPTEFVSGPARTPGTPRLRRALRLGPLWLGVGLVLLGFSLSKPAASQVWEVHNNANVLRSVSAIGTDIWCPSPDGLHSFDSVDGGFTRYFREPGGLVSNDLRIVEGDLAGNVWVGSVSRGLSFLMATGQWRRLGEFEGIPSDSITALHAFGAGMWIGTQKGLAFWDGTQVLGLWPDGVNPSPFRSNWIRDIEVFDDRTWIATRDGVFTTTDGLTWTEVSNGLTDTDVISLGHDGTRLWGITAIGGRVWSGGQINSWSLTETGLAGGARRLAARAGTTVLATPSGIYRWDGTSWSSLGGPTSGDVEIDEGGTFWAGNESGLWKRVGTTWNNLRSPGPGDNWIQGMCLEGSKLYVSTRFGGVARFDNSRGWRQFRAGANPDTSLRSNNFIFMALCDRDGYKWFGDWDGSIARLDDSDDLPQVTHFFYSATNDSLQWTWGWSSAQDPVGRRWFGMDTCCRGGPPGTEPIGLIRIEDDGTRRNFRPPAAQMSGSQVRDIAFGPDGRMWVGYADVGVDVYTDFDLQARQAHIGLNEAGGGLKGSANVWAIEFQGSDAWVLTDGNASLMSVSGNGTITRREEIFGIPPISGQGAVNPMALDGEGGIWFATSSGVLRREADGTFESYTSENSPLLSDDVHSIVIDRSSGDVWIGTVAGINRFRPGQVPGGDDVSSSSSLNITPNPIRYSVAGTQFTLLDAQGTPLRRTDVQLYDNRGRLVSEMRTDDLGTLEWVARDRFGNRLYSGVYFLRALGFDAQGRRVATGQGRLVVTP